MTFSNLQTLILDKNQIQSNLVIPTMENLTTLCVNHNKIENLAIFIKNVCLSCPNLKYLSMLNNPAAPSYFNGGTVAEHKNYRFYVISRLRFLKMLDDKEISDEERSQAAMIFGKLLVKKKESVKASKKANISESNNIEIKNNIVDDNNILDVILPNVSQPLDIDLPNLNTISNKSLSSSHSSSFSSSHKDDNNQLPDEYLENLPNLNTSSSSESN